MLSSWFHKYEDRQLATKILNKACEEAKETNNILDLHFTLGLMAENYYRQRNDEQAAFDNAVKACEEQINIAPQAATKFRRQKFPGGLPAHTGYDQLLIILKKQGEYKKAIQLCEQAKKQGWMGNWNEQIEELKKKENKTS